MKKGQTLKGRHERRIKESRGKRQKKMIIEDKENTSSNQLQEANKN